MVVKGDTLAKIAKSNGVTSAALAKANGINGTMIKLGQKLKIPESAGAGVAVAPAATTPAKAVVAAAAVVLFVGGAPIFPLLMIGVLGLIGVGLVAVSMPERMDRLVAFMNPEAHRQGGGYQVTQALIALGSGGTRGVGLGQSIQKMFYLPEAHTDFIFPIVGEELGLLATLSVVFLFLMIISDYK